MARTDFTPVAKALHWLMAVLIVGQLVLGWAMTEESLGLLDGHAKTVAAQWHKSFGMTILLLAVIRVAWRLRNPPPPFPSYLPRWKRAVATNMERLLYAVFIAMPGVGWMIISTMPRPALYFGLFPIPNLPILPDLPNRKEMREVLIDAHAVLASLVLGLVLMHIGAALKHHFLDRDDIMFRMTPRGLRPLLELVRRPFARPVILVDGGLPVPQEVLPIERTDGPAGLVEIGGAVDDMA